MAETKAPEANPPKKSGRFVFIVNFTANCNCKKVLEKFNS
jgi:hypothetical protein